jgi:hypothetical protein
MGYITRSTKSKERSHYVRIVKSGLPINGTGLSALPLELLIEITSYLRYVPVPCNDFISDNEWYLAKIIDSKYCERFDTVSALSRTCRRLRHIFLPITWQRLDVCATRKPTSSSRGRRSIFEPDPMFKLWHKYLATELVRQLEVVTIRAPALAAHVQ